MSKKTVIVRVEPELYYLISLAAAKEKLSMNQFVIDLLKRTCEKDDS